MKAEKLWSSTQNFKMLPLTYRYVGLQTSLPLNASLVKDQQDNNQEEDQDSDGSQGDTEVCSCQKIQFSFAFIELVPFFRYDLQNAAEEKGIESMLKTVNKITKIQIDGRNTRQNPVNPNKY